MPDQSLLIQISRDIATNTEATKNIEKKVDALNGKIATQESFSRTLQSAVDAHSKALETINLREEKRKDTKSRIAWLTIDNIFKFVFGVAITYLLYKAGLN